MTIVSSRYGASRRDSRPSHHATWAEQPLASQAVRYDVKLRRARNIARTPQSSRRVTSRHVASRHVTSPGQLAIHRPRQTTRFEPYYGERIQPLLWFASVRQSIDVDSRQAVPIFAGGGPPLLFHVSRLWQRERCCGVTRYIRLFQTVLCRLTIRATTLLFPIQRAPVTDRTLLFVCVTAAGRFHPSMRSAVRDSRLHLAVLGMHCAMTSAANRDCSTQFPPHDIPSRDRKQPSAARIAYLSSQFRVRGRTKHAITHIPSY